jgi:hypothetical protein
MSKKTKRKARAERVKRYGYDKPRAQFSVPANDPEFLFSYEWRKLRLQALKLHGATCQCCGASPATGAVMNVDHIKPRRLFPKLALDINNLQILCRDCNHGKGNWDQTDWRPSPDASFDPIDGLNELLKSF